MGRDGRTTKKYSAVMTDGSGELGMHTSRRTAVGATALMHPVVRRRKGVGGCFVSADSVEDMGLLRPMPIITQPRTWAARADMLRAVEVPAEEGLREPNIAARRRAL